MILLDCFKLTLSSQHKELVKSCVNVLREISSVKLTVACSIERSNSLIRKLLTSEITDRTFLVHVTYNIYLISIILSISKSSSNMNKILLTRRNK